MKGNSTPGNHEVRAALRRWYEEERALIQLCQEARDEYDRALRMAEEAVHANGPIRDVDHARRTKEALTMPSWERWAAAEHELLEIRARKIREAVHGE